MLFGGLKSYRQLAQFRLNVKQEKFERKTSVALPIWNTPAATSTTQSFQNRNGSSEHTIKFSLNSSEIQDVANNQIQASPLLRSNSTTAPYLAASLKNDASKHKEDPISGLSPLPQWILEYAAWHNEQRAKFPDELLLTHPDAPKLYIRHCPRRCGGLHDRMKSLTQYIHEASSRNRVLFLKWYNKYELESYLQPNVLLMNWTLPSVANVTDTPDALLQYANHSSFKTVVYHVRDDKPEVASTEVVKSNKRIQLVSFSSLWHSLFQPSFRLQQLLNHTRNDLNLQQMPQHQPYAALHLRMRHPANYNMRRDTGMDLTGLPWGRDHERQTFIQKAIRALNCTKGMVSKKQKENNDNKTLPLYIFSDSKEIVNYLVHVAPNVSIDTASILDRTAHDLVQDWQLIARDVAVVNAHLDAPNQTWHAYAGTFVDLYIAMNAQCLSLGVGNFAVLSVLISPNNNKDGCVMNYAPRSGIMARAWGYHKLPSAQVCDLP